VQAADNVKFGCTFANALVGALVDFVECVGVCARRIGIAAERTEFAMRDANVGRIDVAVDVVVGDVAVLFLADVVGEPADSEKVRRTIELDAVVKRKAFAARPCPRSASEIGRLEAVHSFQIRRKFRAFHTRQSAAAAPRTKGTKY